MKILKNIIFPILIFISACILAFIIEDEYTKYIYKLYSFFSKGRIAFYTSKEFQFASNFFVYSFAIFSTLLYFILKNQTFKKIAIKLFTSIIIVLISTLVICYIDSVLKLATCTNCIGDLIIYHYNVKTDFIFVASLFFGLLPFLLKKRYHIIKKK